MAIANPSTLGEAENTLLQPLSRVDVAREREILEATLRPLQEQGRARWTILSHAAGVPATPRNLRHALSETGENAYHILHIVAHGLFVRGQYHLVLENEDGAHEFLAASMLSELAGDSDLRLAVLASCRSGSSEEGYALRALGPDLVRSGVPAVVAMQDLLSFSTASRFNRDFYSDLARSGRVDMAMAATRTAIYAQDGPDSHTWGIPVLFMGGNDGWLFGMNDA